ncbi:MAG: orotidine 5-phosphate decarboxylase, partial [Deltaproteobacteria bacterium]|nr:orotidine 5-phosphate decarboxylase [Deltaproteobacteria bacterium]
QQVAAVATAGIPWASWVAQTMNLPMLYVRPSTKEHGQTNQIEGRLITEETVLIEDLLSTGDSSLRALDALRDEDVFVTNIFAIFSYQFPSTIKTLHEYEIKTSTIVEFGDLLAYAKEYNHLSEEEIRDVLEWQKNPQGWRV